MILRHKLFDGHCISCLQYPQTEECYCYRCLSPFQQPRPPSYSQQIRHALFHHLFEPLLHIFVIILISRFLAFDFARELVSDLMRICVWLVVTFPMDCISITGFIYLYAYLWYLLISAYLDPDLKFECWPWGYLSSSHGYIEHMESPTFSENKEYHELVLEAKILLSDLLPGTGVSEQLLIAPRKYQGLLEDASDEFRRHLLRLGYGDDKIDSICDELNRILTEAQKLLDLMWLLEALLKFLTLAIAVCFSEFPNNIRPPCTTMPWIIVPALFVLWGVCWMFINTGSFSLSDIDTETLQNAVLSFDHELFPVENLDDINWEYFDNFRNLNPSGEVLFNHQSNSPLLDMPLEPQEQISTQQISFPWIEPSHMANKAASFELPWQSASNETGFLIQHNQLDVLPSTSSDFTTCIAAQRENAQTIFMPTSKDLSPTASGLSTLFSECSEGKNIAVDEASQHVMSATGIEKSLNIAKKRGFRCGNVGCEDLIFNYESQLKKHLDRHNRPFICSECNESFGSTKDLKRHLDTKHQKEGQVFCTVNGCKRGHLGFSRRDNLLKHIHNVHEQRDRSNGPSKLVAPDEDVAKKAKITKKRKRHSDEFDEFSREELIESLLEEQSKNKRLLQEMEQQKGKLEEDLRAQRERYEKNEDRLWRMIDEKR